MVNDILNQIKSKYSVDIQTTKASDKSTFIDISSQINELKIKIHYLDGVLYSVEFLNNDFFEIELTKLEYVLDAILRGDYEIQKTIFGNPSIRVRKDSEWIIPERVGRADKATKVSYKELPKKF